MTLWVRLFFGPDAGIEVEIINHFRKQRQEPEGFFQEIIVGRRLERPEFEEVPVHAYGNTDLRVEEREVYLCIPLLPEGKYTFHQGRCEDIP